MVFWILFQVREAVDEDGIGRQGGDVDLGEGVDIAVDSEAYRGHHEILTNVLDS
jgi:hypothetical protein